MPRTIKVISSDKDGADLRGERVRNKYYSRCDGRADDGEINEALSSASNNGSWGIPASRWEQIFGKASGVGKDA